MKVELKTKWQNITSSLKLLPYGGSLAAKKTEEYDGNLGLNVLHRKDFCMVAVTKLMTF